jgi:hypothetical protein
MSVWEDVVTTALIGTDRRPVPDQLPASWGAQCDDSLDPARTLLVLAARHRAVTRAGGLLPWCPPAEVGPHNQVPLASRAAHELLARLLSPPQIELLNLWLSAAGRHHVGVSAAHWTPLAMVATRSGELDRMALANAIGERGVWFVEQNPQWARLARALRSHLQDKVPSQGKVRGLELTADAICTDPELIMQAATPWSDELTGAVLKIILGGQLQQRGPRYAARVGSRLPLQHYEMLRSAVQQVRAQQVPLSPAGVRSVREAILALERTVWLRIEMHSAFTGKPIMVERLEIPQS